jgi:hypothetical protein
MNKTIYTCIVGEGYELRNPEKKCSGWNYVCYTNQDIKSDVWKIRNIPESPFTDRQASRVHKILGLELNNQDYTSIYIDSKFRPLNNLDGFVKYYLGDNDLSLLKHNRRECVYKEAKYLAKNIEPWESMRQQINKYLDCGLPKDYGLWAPGIMIRRNSKVIQAFNKLWWREYCEGSERDILSLAYSIWRSPHLKIGLMPFRATYKRWRK